MTMAGVAQEAVDAAFGGVRKAGTVVVTGLNGPGVKNIQIPSFELTLFQKRIHGALFGSGNPFDDIPRMHELYRYGHLKLDELITNRYQLDEVNQDYRDLTDGKNLRGVMIIDH